MKIEITDIDGEEYFFENVVEFKLHSEKVTIKTKKDKSIFLKSEIYEMVIF